MVKVNVESFVSTCCNVCPTARCAISELRAAYIRWAVANGAGKGSGVRLEDPMGFHAALVLAGVDPVVMKDADGVSCYLGVGLTADAEVRWGLMGLRGGGVAAPVEGGML